MTHAQSFQAIPTQSVPTGYTLFTAMTDRCLVVTEHEIRVAIALDGRVMRQGSIEPHVLLVMPRHSRVPPHDPELDPSRALEVALYVQASGVPVPALDALNALPAYDPFGPGHCGESSIVELLGKKPGKRAMERIQKIRYGYQTVVDLGKEY